MSVNDAEKFGKQAGRLDLVEMPRDLTQSMSNVRQAVVASFNNSRRYPRKMAILKEVMEFMVDRITQWEKATLELEALEQGVEVDSRKTVEGMQAQLSDAVEKKDTVAEATPTTGTTAPAVPKPATTVSALAKSAI